MQDQIRVMENRKVVRTNKPVDSYNKLFTFPMTNHQLETYLYAMRAGFCIGKACVIPGKLTFGCDRNNFYILGGPADDVKNVPISAKYYRYREKYPEESLIQIDFDPSVRTYIAEIIKKHGGRENPFGGIGGPDNHTAAEITFSDGSIVRIFMSDGQLYFCSDLRQGEYTYD